MSFETGIEFPFGMKYDLTNLIKSSLKESYSEYKEYQKAIRNKLIILNELEKKKFKAKNKNYSYLIYRKKRNDQNECVIDISRDNVIPKGYFCYPIKAAYFQKGSFEMPFNPILPFEKFKEGMDAFDGQRNLSDTYLAYPCLLQKDYIRIKNKLEKKKANIFNQKSLDNISSNLTGLKIRPAKCESNINKYFILWSFIKIIKGQTPIMGNDFNRIYSLDKNKIIVPILKEMSNLLEIELNILYFIIVTFLSDLEKKIKRDSLIKKGISYKKYEKYWCKICNRFFCPFHFKIKIKTKEEDNGNIRTSYEYLKKIQITLRIPEYSCKENEESEENKNELKKEIQKTFEQCDYCNKKRANTDDKNYCLKTTDSDDNFAFDEGKRFTKMFQIKDKEDFFILCKIVKTCYKLLTKYLENKNKKKYSNYEIFNILLSPCVLRKVLHNKYDCELMRYLTKIITDNEFLSDINKFLGKLPDNGIEYEKLPEENLLFFNNFKDTSLSEQKYTNKGEQKIKKVPRNKATARLQIQSEKNLYYKPCDHYPSACTEEICDCAKNGICFKYCCCFKEEALLNSTNNICNYMFLGCSKHPLRAHINCTNCECKKFNIECVPGICECKDKCVNNNITLGNRKKLIYGYSYQINGGGLFAGEYIEKGEFVDIYCGEIVEKDELDRLSVFYDQTGNNYPFNINKKFDFVAIKCGGLTRYINHGSFGEENIKADKIMVNGIPYIAFYANKDIPKFKELFYDYSYDDNSMPQWMKEYIEQKKVKKKKNKNIEEVKQKNFNKKKQSIHEKGKILRKMKDKEKEKKHEDDKNKNRNLINLDEEEDDY